ncbi:hypothetical protein [Rugamonas aquatica]|uniref:hypothetical protein n=1 Tax=Rugamonas aquatica TaxID=2743357 RepID=UPI001F22AD02|nr:hypothetical protein [Rugamonas aquatica]
MFATMSVQVSPITLLALMERLRETGASRTARLPMENAAPARRHMAAHGLASGYADSVRNAWQDISIRMPGEKNWKIADVRRRELARATAAPAAPAAPTAAAATPAASSNAAHMPAAQPAPRDTTPAQGLTEPERRKYRFRLEDVAFD